MEKNSSQEIYSKVIAKAWSDPQFKEKLLKNPESTLQAEGFEIPQGTKIILHENTDKELYLVIPQKPEGELTDEQLEAVSGGLIGIGLMGVLVAAIKDRGSKIFTDVWSPWLKK